MTTLDVDIQGSIRTYMAGEAVAVVAGARSAVKRQTEQTKTEARAVVNAGLTGSAFNRSGSRRAALTIRSRDYPETPAGFVHSTWGYFDGGQFRDILAVHERGATIVPKRGRMLFIPFVEGTGRRRSARRQLAGERVDLIPVGGEFGITRGRLLVVTRARGNRQGLVLGILVRQVRIPKRLDFRAVEQRAETGLVEKVIVEIERASQRQATR